MSEKRTSDDVIEDYRAAYQAANRRSVTVGLIEAGTSSALARIKLGTVLSKSSNTLLNYAVVSLPIRRTHHDRRTSA